MDAFKEKIREELASGTVSVNEDKFLIEHLVKSGKHKDIYTLKSLVVDGQMQDPEKYLLKVRYSEKTKEYEENMKRKVTCYGENSIVNAEGKRINLYDGGLCQYFAPIINTNYIYKDEGDFIADYIIQERMWMSLEQFSQYNKLDEKLIILLYKMIMEIADYFREQGYVYTNFSPSSIMIDAKYKLKLVNTSYLQPDIGKPVLTKKIFSTASIEQLTGNEEDQVVSMYWNVLFTLYDLYGGNIMDSNCIKNCSNKGDCIKKILITNRQIQIDNYNKSSDPFFQYFHGYIINGDNMREIGEALRLLEDDKSIYYSFCVMVANTVTRIVRFNAPKITRDTKFICEFDPTTSRMIETRVPEPSGSSETPDSEDTIGRKISPELGPEPRDTEEESGEQPSSDETPSDSEQPSGDSEAPSDSEVSSDSDEESEEETGEQPSEQPGEESGEESKGFFGKLGDGWKRAMSGKKDKKKCVHPYCQNKIDKNTEKILATKFDPPRKCFTAKICADEESFKEIMAVLDRLGNKINVHIPEKKQDKWMELQDWWKKDDDSE